MQQGFYQSLADGNLATHIHGAIQSSPCCSVNRGRTPQTDNANLQPELVNEKRRYVSHVCRLFASELCGQLGPTGERGGPFNCASWTSIQWINLNSGGCTQHSLCDGLSMFRVSYIIRDVVVGYAHTCGLRHCAVLRQSEHEVCNPLSWEKTLLLELRSGSPLSRWSPFESIANVTRACHALTCAMEWWY